MGKTANTQALQQELLADAMNWEHGLAFWEAVKLFRKAIGWSVVMSTALIMDGHDTKIVSSLLAQPAFQEAYGTLQGDGSYQIPASWQSGLTNGSNIGQLIGVATAATICERFGFRKTMIGALFIIPCLVFIQFFASGLAVLEVGQVLLGESHLRILSTAWLTPLLAFPLGCFRL